MIIICKQLSSKFVSILTVYVCKELKLILMKYCALLYFTTDYFLFPNIIDLEL